MAREASITADAVHDDENSQLEQKINTTSPRSEYNSLSGCILFA